MVLTIDFGGISTTHVVIGAFVTWLLLRYFSAKNLRHIPTVGGPSVPILSIVALYNFLANGKKVVLDGYQKFKGRVFKVALLDRWLVVICNPRLVEELQKLPEALVGYSLLEIFETKHIFGADLLTDPVHLALLRTLTRNLGQVFGDMYQEVETAFQELVPANEKEWLPVHASPVMRTIVTRAANRVFVGVPVCRDEGYLYLMVHFAEDVNKAFGLYTVVPSFAQGFVARKAKAVMDDCIERCLGYMRPAIKDRTTMMDSFGDNWADKPNDMIQWTIEETKARGQGEYDMARMLMFINSGAVETTSQAVIHALYDISMRPELADELREEVERAIAEDGWTKDATNKMRKLDSFLRESQRINGPMIVSMFRLVREPVTLSDGTFFPAGTTIASPTLGAHFDDTIYPNASTFDPLRFYKAEAAGQPQFVTTSPEYLTFGHGKHACPGRFFAVNELKAILAYMLMHYDIKPEQEGVRPENKSMGLGVLPNPDAKVMFRKRHAG
uniref:Cytochrome P450 n=1 Tax=Phanerodontia chrysosporium TaxID=2822231 RepID=Q587P5_PHACH|nr:cytochrome P450 [Phanerodontia chrysosporium]